MHFVSVQRKYITMAKKIPIEVAYAGLNSQIIVSVEVLQGSTIQAAIEHSGILAIFPDINLVKQKVGIFSQLKNLSDLVSAGDRIEIYRPLKIDPKEARRLRAGSF